ncbi:hypothetical protein [Persicobacter diffluens]|uniref:SGNH hydrolase-type esterase domain-containing protein n=1 Tax=Persicobacter diffluens TaxID=981 RepID=A0AAN5AMY9_9BACT|nr:hypothetical protein PEDI_54960 [Persicobacter diffluens]
MSNLKRKANALTNIVYVLLGGVFFNPFVIYAVTNSLLLSLGSCLGLIVVLVIGKLLFKTNALNVYVVNFAAIISVFLHAELVFNNNFIEYNIEDLYNIKEGYYFNKPYLNQRINDKEYSVDYITNSQGFRISRNSLSDKEVSKADWLFIGDSYTQGAQVEFEELYTSLLYRDNPDKIIVNAGISGFGIPQEYAYYKYEGHKLNASKVFLQLCNFNDFMQVEERNFGWTDYLMQHSNFIRYLLYDFKYANPAELPLGRWTEPFYPSRKENELFNIFYKESSKQKEADITNVRHYIELLNEECIRNNAELVILLIPTKEQVSDRFLAEVLQSYDIAEEDLDMERPNRLVSEIGKDLGIEVIDTYNSFKRQGPFPFFDYDEHLNRYGHQLLANAVNRRYLSTEVKMLSTSSVGDRYPTFSPDGSQILYQSFKDRNTEIFVGDSLMHNVSRLTFNDIDEIHPHYCQVNDKLVFTEGDQATLQTNVVMMNPDQSERIVITSSPTEFGAIPYFSPDGGKLTYPEWTVDEEGGFTNPQIVILDLKNEEKQYITTDAYESWRPVFSPDGSSVAYISKQVEEQFDVFLYDLEKEEVMKITETPYDEWDPSFSWDGKKVAYAGFYSDNWDLFVYSIEEGYSERITTTKGDEWDPAFHPDNKRIIYAGEYGLNNGIYIKTIEQGPKMPVARPR